jgi:hypothetical protein
MNSLIFLIVLLSVYYYIYTNHYEILDDKYHYYFYAFCGTYVLLLYMYHYEYPFVYRLLKNVYETDKKSLYSFDAKTSNAELFESQYPNFNIKETLLQKQAGRCSACSNFIMKDDLHNCKLKYKNSLQKGGQNNIENIGLVCPNCFAFD